MQPRDFCYWLKGFFELTSGSVELTPHQSRIIEDHLDLVFDKKTPTYVNSAPKGLKPVEMNMNADNFKFCHDGVDLVWFNNGDHPVSC